MFRLDRKVAVVTGAGSGIGAAIAETFARQGAWVFVLDLDENAAEATQKRIKQAGGAADVVQCDVSNAKDVAQAFNHVSLLADRLDILVNNAGIAHIGSVETTTEADLDRIYAVNVKGIFMCSHEAVPRMRRDGGGVIMNLPSIRTCIAITDGFANSMITADV